MKRLVMLIIICLIAGMIAPGVGVAASFTDTSTHWAEDDINMVANAGYVSGYADGSFKPDKIVTRAEFTSVLIRCLGYEPNTAANSIFADMKSHWAKGYINKAVDLGIIIRSDYGNNFGPDNGLQRSEVCAMLVRALGKKPDNSQTNFKDTAAINKSVHRGYIKVAVDTGLLKGYPNGNFEPFQKVTRAQMCRVLISLMAAQGRPIDTDSSDTDTDTNTTVDSTTNTDTKTSSSTQGSFSSIAIGDEVYRLDITPVTFRVGLNNVSASSLSVQQGYLYINNQYRFALDTALSDLDVTVNNTRYDVNQISTSNNRLVIFPGDRKIASITYGGKKYDADFIDLFIDSRKTSYYLIDMAVVDQYKVKVGGKEYKLDSDKITVKLSEDYYDITKISITSSGTTPTLDATDAVVGSGYTMSSISTIFVDTSIIDKTRIKSLTFIINSERYLLSEVKIDSAGDFIIDDKSVPCTEAIMIADGLQYEIDHISFLKSKLVLYCTEATESNLVKIDDSYYESSKVKILKDNVAYEMDRILVVDEDLIRIAGKQYKLKDYDFMVTFAGKTYEIDEIDYDKTLDMPIIETGSKAEAGTQPVKYVFYVNNSLSKQGIDDDVLIYTNRKWVTFDQIIVSDPSHFTISGTTNELIDAKVMIDNTNYVIADTAWHGSSQVLDVYLED